MIDNLELVGKRLIFQPDIFYYIQVIKRKKDNPKMEGTDKVLHSRFITSLKQLKEEFETVKVLCSAFNARAYISLTPRSIMKFGKESLRYMTEKVLSDCYTKALSWPERIALYHEVLYRDKSIGHKPRWIVDIDNDSWVEPIRSLLEKNGATIVDAIPTPNGKHLLIESFDIKKIKEYLFDKNDFGYRLPGGEEFYIKMAANTILYANPYICNDEKENL